MFWIFLLCIIVEAYVVIFYYYNIFSPTNCCWFFKSYLNTCVSTLANKSCCFCCIISISRHKWQESHEYDVTSPFSHQVISKSNEKTSSKSLHQILPMIRTEVVPGLQISTEKMKGELEIAATYVHPLKYICNNLYRSFLFHTLSSFNWDFFCELEFLRRF